ncbi:MAG: signal recognition particle-docking protein FtsY [Candidatus Eisenbacteria bacterium]
MATLWRRVADRLTKTREVLAEGLQQVFQQRDSLDDNFYEELEAVLLSADVGLDTANGLTERLRDRIRREGTCDPARARRLLHEVVVETLARGMNRAGGESGPSAKEAQAAPGGADSGRSADGMPHVILVVGVNGTGKTTSIGKLAWRYQQAGHRTIVVASDTFRAAALEQLGIWAERAGAELIRSQSGADPAAVAYDGVLAARARGCDVVLVDTAGRLQTNTNLMAELAKIHRVLGKAQPGAPHEVLLVLDATTGQNAISQAALFSKTVQVTGIVIAKLDGSSKGGVILAIADRLGIPVRYVGLGEKIDDLADFAPDDFARALLEPVS